MPSPIGHAIAGFAAGWLIAPAGRPVAGAARDPAAGAAMRRRAWTFAAAGMAADLDLLAGIHHQQTHSVGAALAVGALAWLVLRRRGPSGRTLALAVCASYASHILLDWLAADSTVPYGVMALWPFDSHYYISGLDVFGGITRKVWLARAWVEDALSVARELLILVPVAWVVWRVRRTAEPATVRPAADLPDRGA